MWALVATFVKATTDTLAQFGMAGTSTHWPVYALAVGGVAEGLAGVLAASVPALLPSRTACAGMRTLLSRATLKALAVPQDVGSFGEVLDSAYQFVAVAFIQGSGLEGPGEVDGL
jgi:hypothetical protein